jgi:hypothetical protein
MNKICKPSLDGSAKYMQISKTLLPNYINVIYMKILDIKFTTRTLCLAVLSALITVIYGILAIDYFHLDHNTILFFAGVVSFISYMILQNKER